MLCLPKIYIVKLIVFQFLLIKIILSEQGIISNINNTFTFINDEILELIKQNLEQHQSIHKFDIPDGVKDLLLKYNQTIILPNKNIIKINETHFICFGLKENNIWVKIYEIDEGNNIIIINEQYYTDPNDNNSINIDYLEGKIITENKILLTSIIENNFEIIIMDLNTNELKINIIPEYETTEFKSYKKDQIHCESVDEKKFLCVLNYLNNYFFNLYFIEVNLDNLEDINYNLICNNYCVSGNIMKIDNLNNKYLICHQNCTNQYLYTFCQEYFFNDNNIYKKDIYEVGKIQYENTMDNPLNLYLYKNSIFIQFDIKSNDFYKSILIVSSLDLKINIKSVILERDFLSTISLKNDDNYLYIFYEEEINFDLIKIDSLKFKECLSIDSLIISNEN